MKKKDIEAIYPLTPMQEGMLFHSLYSPQSGVYVQQLDGRLEGDLDADAFKQAWQGALDRHPGLRTAFLWEGLEKPMQVVGRRVSMPIDIRDWSGLTEGERRQRLEAYLAEDRREGFKLSKAPLMRMALFRLGDGAFHFVWTHHHILVDGWSVAILLKEVFGIYEACLRGRRVSLPDARPYSLYIGWLKRQNLKDAEAYWRRVLAGFSAPTSLTGLGSKEQAAPSEEYERILTELTASQTEALSTLARRSRLTLNSIVQGAWALLLSRYSRESDIVFGVASAGRPTDLPGVESVVGLFVNTLPMRVILSPTEPLIPWLQRLQEGQAAQRQFEYTPLSEIQRWSELPNSVPLFETMLAYENYPIDEAQQAEPRPSLEIRSIRAFERTNYPITLQASGSSELVLRILYDKNRFEPRSTSRLLAHLKQLLAEIAADPARRLCEFSLLAPGEKARILEDWNGTDRSYPAQATLHGCIEDRLSQDVEAIALEFEGETMTRRELSVRSNQLANFLRARGVGPEVPVGICMERSFEMVVSLLGILKAGGAYVPLDPGYPQERLRFMLQDSGVETVLTQDRLRKRLSGSSIEAFPVDRGWPEIASQGSSLTSAPSSADHLAYVIYTSGSTGQPKGAMNCHRGICNRLFWMQERYGLNQDDRVLQKTPFSFDVSVWEFFWPLMTGARMVLAKPGGHQDSTYLADRIQASRITTLHFVPSMLNAFLEEDRLERRCSSLKRVICSGEALSWSLRQRFIARLEAELHNLYGPTEAAVDVSSWDCRSLDWPGTVPIGSPIANVQLPVLDADRKLLPEGLAGELHIGGVQVGRGYWRQPRLTAERFIPDPFASGPGRRLYRTGDLVRYLPDGNIEFLGRIDDQVKVRGVRIEPGEIEYQLDRHPHIKQNLVTMREERPGDKRLVAYVVPQPQEANAASAQLDAGRERVDQWRNVYEETYSSTVNAQDPTFNLVGWNSSYTGQPLSPEEMREWVDQTVERVLARRPSRVLEIGCGTGLLLHRIAPRCDRYWATDFSQAVLAQLGRQIEQGGDLRRSHIVLLNRPAHDFSEIEEGAFDCVILNSVVQYFPGIDYFLQVLQGAAKAVVPGGFIYLGDLRNLRLQAAFQASVELAKASPETEGSVLASRVRRRIEQEEELLIDPRFFQAAQSFIPQVSRATTQLRRGLHQNELSAFRYDAVLNVGEAPRESEECARLGWQDHWQDLAPAEKKLSESMPPLLRIENVPNRRVASACRAAALLDPGSDRASAREIRAALDGDAAPTTDPEEAWALGRKLGYEAQVTWSQQSEGRFDVVLTRNGSRPLPMPPAGSSAPLPLEEYANDPLQALRNQRLVPALRAFLQERVPPWMVPSSFVVLNELPLSPNGKVDRRALPSVGADRPDMEQAYAPPRDDREKALAEIWSEVLGLEQVGIEDNFFALGGDSIRSIQVRSKARKRGISFSLQELFKAPTISRLAALEAKGEKGTDSISTDAEPFAQISAQDRAQLEASIEDAFPLSRMQAGMLFHSELNPETNVYHDVFTSHLKAPLDVEVLESALSRLVARHPALRTSFDLTRFSQPLQLVHSQRTASLGFDDWSAVDEEEQSSRLARWMESEKASHFDWSSRELIRFHVHRRSPDSFQFTLSFHHAILDGWSVAVMLTELFQLYFGRLRPERVMPVAPAPSCGPRDFVALERRALESSETRLFWQEQLQSHSETRLPRLPGPSRPRRVLVREAPLSRRLSEKLGALSRSLHLPLKSILLAAHLKVLSLTTGQSAATTGLVSSSRPETADGDRALGLFLNTLPLAAELAPGSWKDLIRRTFDQEQAMLPHRRFPIAELQRMNGGSPLFETAFNFVHFHVYQAIRDAGEVEYLGGEFATETNFALMANFNLDISSQQIRLELDYDASQLCDDQIEEMGQAYRLTLSQIASSPDSLHHYGIGVSPQQGARLQSWNATARPYASGRCLHWLVEEQAQRTPDLTAVEFEDKRLSYAQLDRKANQLARCLQRRGVGPDVAVGVLLERSPEMVVALLAVLKAGGAYVPLDPSYPAERILFMLRDSKAPVIITHKESQPNPEEHKASLIRVDRPDSWADESEEPLQRQSCADHLAYVIYTSGSTGRPKGAMNTHRAICNRLFWMQEAYGLEAADRVLQKTPFSFDVSVWEFFWPLMTGARLVLARPGGHRDGDYLVELIRKAGITTVHFVPSMLEAFLRTPAVEQCRSLQRVICSGEALLPSHRERFLSALEADLHNLYGPTEAAVDVSSFDCSNEAGTPTVPIGRPIANLSLHVLNAHLQPLPLGASGELLIGGQGLGRGYWRRPRLTAERFIPSPMGDEPGARLYRSGDSARVLPDGNIEFLGRLDFQVKIRGFRVELGEIESALTDHPGVRQALVGVRPADSGGLSLVGGLVPQPGQDLDQVEVRDHLLARLPDHMIPARFAILPSLPLQPNGKLDRKAAQALLDEARAVAKAPHVPPSSPAERLIAGIWQQVLGVERVGVRDDFFELGGHSLNATQLVARLRDAFQTELALARLFQEPTVEGVTACLVEAWGDRETVEEIARAVLEVQSLSDEQASRMLAQAAQAGDPHRA